MRDYPHATTDRFAVLHDTADSLVDDLTQRYMVERRETKEHLGADQTFARTVHLIPRTPAAAPLAIAFTGLPGLRIRFGRWWTQSLPDCACPGCEENPERLAEELRNQTEALIEGGLWERVRRGWRGSWFEARLIGVRYRDDRAGPLAPEAARLARVNGFAAAVQWAPWPRRA